MENLELKGDAILPPRPNNSGYAVPDYNALPQSELSDFSQTPDSPLLHSQHKNLAPLLEKCPRGCLDFLTPDYFDAKEDGKRKRKWWYMAGPLLPVFYVVNTISVVFRIIYEDAEYDEEETRVISYVLIGIHSLLFFWSLLILVSLTLNIPHFMEGLISQDKLCYSIGMSISYVLLIAGNASHLQGDHEGWSPVLISNLLGYPALWFLWNADLRSWVVIVGGVGHAIFCVGMTWLICLGLPDGPASLLQVIGEIMLIFQFLLAIPRRYFEAQKREGRVPRRASSVSTSM